MEATQRQAAVLRPAGDLDVYSKVSLQEQLASVQDSGVTIVDLSAVTFIDSSGLTVLIEAYKRLLGAGGQLRLVVADGQQVQRILQITGLVRMFAIFPTLEAAQGDIT